MSNRSPAIAQSQILQTSLKAELVIRKKERQALLCTHIFFCSLALYQDEVDDPTVPGTQEGWKKGMAESCLDVVFFPHPF
mmetsp:Transcript_23108/g.43128  ORF Transcript_23108/g.43128 Transcript_23108/m.43128 type:complete len:80 (-) Transcript_23108:12-251(-)